MATNVVIDYTPTAKQRLFHESVANEVLYGGAAGGGKSVAIVMDALSRCLCFPTSKAYIFRRTYRELEDTIIAEALASYPHEIAAYNVGRHEMAVCNGSKICFRHCLSVADMYAYAGAEIHWLYFDELTSFEREIYEFIKTRLRAKKALGLVPVVRSSSNPGNIGHGWVKAYFVDAGPYYEMVTHEIRSEALHESKLFTTQYIPALPTDNPHITKDYIYELERKDPNLRRALLYGDWDAFERTS
jgi:phage terminase large subunit